MKYCRIYPENKSLYYRFCIFPNKKSLIEHRIRNDFHVDCDACVLYQYTVDYSAGHPGASPYMGDICVYAGETGSGLLSHEATHAAHFYYQRRYKKDVINIDDDEQEEHIANIVGNIMAQMVSFLYKTKVI